MVIGSITVKAQYTDLLDFNGSLNPQGDNPQGSLIFSVTGDTVFGMTGGGGANSDGAVFSVKTNGAAYHDMLDFNVANGRAPAGDLTFSRHRDTLFGMTLNGGVNTKGNIFSIKPDGSGYVDMFDFNFSNGRFPESNLTLSVTGDTLFGMANSGGANNLGVIFSIRTNGAAYTDLHDFVGANGQYPNGALTYSITKDTLFGTTYQGGAHGAGVIFCIKTDGSGYHDLYDFAGGVSGSTPLASLTLSANGDTLFGSASIGGANGQGLLFSVKTDGTGYRDILDFNGASSPQGSAPQCTLALSGNTLYGVTPTGGANNIGVVFSVNTNGTHYVDMFDFTSLTGSTPYGSVALTGSTLYGMTYQGGANSRGAVFSFLTLNANAVVDSSSTECRNAGQATATPTGGTGPYTYLWAPGGQTNATLTGLSSGTYTVTVTDSHNSISIQSIIITQPAALNIIQDSVNATSGCNGSAKVIASGGTAPYTYNWAGGGTNDTIQGKCAGNYCCIITDKNGCTQNVCVTILNATGINEISHESKNIKIWPNPTTGKFSIQSPIAGQVAVDIYNMMGEKVLTQKLTSAPLSMIDISSQPEGIYFCRVTDIDGKSLGTSKIIMQK